MFPQQQSAGKALASKRQRHRVNIRRQQVDRAVRVKREMILEEMKDLEIEKELVLISISNQMKDEPNQTWTSHLSVLVKLQIRTKEDVQMWVGLGLLKRLLKLLKEQYRDFDPEFDSANIVSKLLYADQTNQELKRVINESNCAKCILEIIDREIDEQRNCFEGIEAILLLLGNLCYSCRQFRYTAVKQGAVQTLIKLSFQAQSQDNHISLCWLVRSICKSHEGEESIGLAITYNQTSAFLPILSKQINSTSHQTVKFALECLLTLIDETQYKISSLFYIQNLRQRLLKLAKLENGSGEGLLAQRILGYMCSCTNPTFASRLVEEGILDSLQNGLKICSTLTEPLRETCWIIRNIVLNSESDCHEVIRHSIFEHFLDLCCSPILERKAQYITFLLRKIIDSLTSVQLAEIIKKSRILQALVISINSFTNNSGIVLECLHSICRLVIYQGTALRELGRADTHNTLIETLQLYYNFPIVLEQLTQSKNEKVSAISTYLINLFSC